MGRTLYGVDLDRSPLGGLIKRLLTDEELEMLADGGFPGEPADRDESEDAAAEDELSGDVASVGVGHGGDYRPSSVERGESDDEDTGRIRGFVSSHRGLLLKGGAALALLAVLGVLVWRYQGEIKSKLPERLGGESEPDDSTGDDGYAGTDVSPARRRAKADARAEAASQESTAADATSPEDERATQRGRRTRRSDQDSSRAEAAASAEDVDLGALVGLGTLALIATLVRRFGEDRPHDPLVDGSEDAQRED